MKKLLGALGLVLVAGVCLAQGAGETAANAAASPGFFSWDNLSKLMEYGLVVFTFVAGLKNVKWFADFFVAWPWLSPALAAASAFAMAIILCIKEHPVHDMNFFTCLATAIGILLSAATIHGIIAKVSPHNEEPPAVNMARVAKLEGGKK
jgi:hypothetical protein